MEFLLKIGEVVWGTPTILLLVGTGIWLTVRSGFFQFTHVKTIYQHTIRSLFANKEVRKATDHKSFSRFQALSTMLAATIGTGNIAGVATALAIGGPGAVFWMWVSALFGMMTAYAEHTLGVKYRYRDKDGEWVGGPMIYLERGLKTKRGLRHLAKPLAGMFAFFCILASFGIGNLTQSNSISVALYSAFHIPPVVTGVVLAVGGGFVLFGGIRRLGKVTETLVPVMAVGYVLGCLAVIGIHFTTLPAVFGDIMRGAFGINAVTGGISGAMLKTALSTGVRRGVFSNEAGLGASVIAGSSSDVKSAKEQGMWGIFAVFFDTIVSCTLTALAVLCSGVLDTTTKEGAAVVGEAFGQSFGAFGEGFVAVSMLCFAFSTLIGWSFYGQKATAYLFGKRYMKWYLVAFVPMILMGAILNLNLVWSISDSFNGLMAIPNLIGILCLSGCIWKKRD